MQQQVDVESQVALEVIDELVCFELRLQEIFNGDDGARARDLDVATAALNVEDADLVAGDSQANTSPLALGVTFPFNDYTLVGKLSNAVLVRAKLWNAACTFEFTLVVILPREGHEESFFAAMYG